MRRGTKPYLDQVKHVRALVTERVHAYAKAYGITHGTISIRKQKTRWGSCTKAGNLSFNYRLGFLPPHLLDYVVVHELCHIVHHNHSAAFWNAVARACPNPKALRKELGTYRF